MKHRRLLIGTLLSPILLLFLLCVCLVAFVGGVGKVWHDSFRGSDWRAARRGWRE